MNVIAAGDLPNAPGPHWRIGALASDKYSALTLNLKSGALMSAFSTYQMIFSVQRADSRIVATTGFEPVT